MRKTQFFGVTGQVEVGTLTQVSSHDHLDERGGLRAERSVAFLCSAEE